MLEEGRRNDDPGLVDELVRRVGQVNVELPEDYRRRLRGITP